MWCALFGIPSPLDYSAYQQQQTAANPYAGYSYGTQAAAGTAQPQTSTATNEGTYQATYPTASANYASTTYASSYTSTTYAPASYSTSSYATTVATGTTPTAAAYGQSSYAGYTTGTNTVASYSTNIAAGQQASYPSGAGAGGGGATAGTATGYQDPNSATRSSADGAQQQPAATYAAQPPPPPQPPAGAAPTPPVGQVRMHALYVCVYTVNFILFTGRYIQHFCEERRDISSINFSVSRKCKNSQQDICTLYCPLPH